MIDAEFIHHWAGHYPAPYDDQYYSPFLEQARQGNADALRQVTQWKNVGRRGRPMALSRSKEAAFQFFLRGLPNYMGENGRMRLRQDFSRRAPVWSTFWHHVLYATPIFDVYTHMAWHWDVTGIILTKREATIYAPGHWPTYDRYTVWFQGTLNRLQQTDAQITERLVDRALVSWGEHQG
ncbi:MAG: hypothetical protein JW993_08400 [Sedimentisphaerales bacterium]|nr:hypothetical protein [Sedimentisphaerales bacterium]